MSATVLQVVPNLDPYGGVASHARKLARELEDHADLVTVFFAPEAHGTAPGDALAAELARHPGAPLLLHYSNYGYERRGCPRWLVAALARWRLGPSGTRLVTIFHEVYATGRPWESSFWLSPVQRRLAARLRRLSDGVATGVDLYGRILRAWKASGDVATLPVFSTVGEPSAPPPLAARTPRLVVFGSAGLRARAYAAGGRALARACAALGIAEIADVGPGVVAPASHDGVPVKTLADLPDEAVSDVLADSRAGFIQYPQAFLGKSTVFGAFASHAVVPVCSWPSNGSADHVDYLWNPARDPSPAWQEVADAARRWYQGHSLSRHAALYAAMLQ